LAVEDGPGQVLSLEEVQAPGPVEEAFTVVNSDSRTNGNTIIGRSTPVELRRPTAVNFIAIGSSALLMTQDRQPEQKPSFFGGFSVVSARRGTGFIKSAEEPLSGALL
jgi:hypothetical protein